MPGDDLSSSAQREREIQFVSRRPRLVPVLPRVGQRRQPRVRLDRDAAQTMAAEINAQLETGAPSALGFEPISIPDLRKRQLEQHEYVRRSSLNTISRYRSATQHLINFVNANCPAARASYS